MKHMPGDCTVISSGWHIWYVHTQLGVEISAQKQAAVEEIAVSLKIIR